MSGTSRSRAGTKSLFHPIHPLPAYCVMHDKGRRLRLLAEKARAAGFPCKRYDTPSFRKFQDFFRATGGNWKIFRRACPILKIPLLFCRCAAQKPSSSPAQAGAELCAAGACPPSQKRAGRGHIPRPAPSGQQQPQLFPQPFPQPQPLPPPQQQQRMISRMMIHRQPPPPKPLLQHPI